MKQSIIVTTIFSIAFAITEAAVVVYLRRLSHFEPIFNQADPPIFLNLGFIAFAAPSVLIFSNQTVVRTEIFRELATIVMLITVAWLGGNNIKQRLGLFLISFSVWDIFYYVFLSLMIGWPKTILDPDIFFLFPIPWIGPVVSPLLISLILLLLGKRLSVNSP